MSFFLVLLYNFIG
jgi:type IV secretory pathway TraG/TraD family ATPase VirD4